MIIRPQILLIPVPAPNPVLIKYVFRILIFCACFGAAVLSGRMMECRIKGKVKNKMNFFCAFLSFAAAVLLILVYGCTVMALKGFVFFLILLYAAVSDIRFREVDDSVHLMIIITGLIGTELSDIPKMFLAAVLVALPQLAVAVLKPGMYGGADIKLSAACVFLLGIKKGYIGLIIGLTLGVIINFIIQIRKNKSEGFPMIPYLAAGFMTVYIN